VASRDNIDSAVRVAIACAATMIANQVAGKAARDAIFLSVYDVSHLPTMVIGAAFASVIAVLATARVMARFGPGRVVPWAFILSAILMMGEWTLLKRTPALAAPLIYLHLAVFGAFLISGFWSLVSERFDPRTARKQMARIAAAATFGGMVGGILAERVAANLTTATMLPILAAMHAVCAVLVLYLRPQRPSAESQKAEKPPLSGFKTLAEVPYLRNLALLVLLGTVAANFLDYVFKATVAGRYSSSEELMRFFALFYTGVGLVTFLVQSIGGRRMLERWGLSRTAVTLPIAVIAGSLGALIAPGLFSATFARAGESVMRSSLFRSAYELFFTPISPREKRATKTFIDVGCDRLGDAVGAGLVRAVIFLVPQIAVHTVLVVLAAAAGAVAAVIVRGLHRGHVRALERNLLARAAELNLDTVEVGLASGVVLQTVATIDLRRVLQAAGASELALQTVADAKGFRPPESVTTARIRRHTTSPAHRDPLVERIANLRADDVAQVRMALADGGSLPPAAVPHAISLLAWDEVTGSAVKALRAVGPRITGQLIDALLDPDEEFTIRRRLPRILGHCNTDRAIDGLLLALADKRFEVRFRCSRALAFIHENAPELEMVKRRVYGAVEREVAVDKRVWKTHRLLDEVDAEDGERLGLVDDFLRDRTTRSLEHVFTMLSLVLPTEPLRVAFRGLHTEDPHLRGTSLEYLESVLPSSIRAKLIPFLEVEPPKSGGSRSPEEILNALLKSSQSIEMSLEQFNRHQAEDRSLARVCRVAGSTVALVGACNGADIGRQIETGSADAARTRYGGAGARTGGAVPVVGAAVRRARAFGNIQARCAGTACSDYRVAGDVAASGVVASVGPRRSRPRRAGVRAEHAASVDRAAGSAGRVRAGRGVAGGSIVLIGAAGHAGTAVCAEVGATELVAAGAVHHGARPRARGAVAVVGATVGGAGRIGKLDAAVGGATGAGGHGARPRARGAVAIVGATVGGAGRLGELETAGSRTTRTGHGVAVDDATEDVLALVAATEGNALQQGLAGADTLIAACAGRGPGRVAARRVAT